MREFSRKTVLELLSVSSVKAWCGVFLAVHAGECLSWISKVESHLMGQVLVEFDGREHGCFWRFVQRQTICRPHTSPSPDWLAPAQSWGWGTCSCETQVISNDTHTYGYLSKEHSESQLISLVILLRCEVKLATFCF